MTIDEILQAIEGFFDTKKKYLNGEISVETLNEFKKKFITAFNDYIDFRLDGVLEQRKKRDDTQIDLSIPEMNAIENQPGAINNIIILFDALNSVPTPPNDIETWIKSDNYKSWLRIYTEWHSTKRIAALKSLAKDLEANVEFIE